MEILKKFALKSTTCSLNERNELFEELFNTILDESKTDEITAGVYKGLGKIVQYLYPIYIDKESKTNLVKLIQTLIKLNREQSLSSLLQSLNLHSKRYISSYPNRSSSLSSIYGIDLLNELIISLQELDSALINSNNDEFKNIVSIYSDFIFCASIFPKQQLFNTVYKRLKYLISKIPNILYEMVVTSTKSLETNPHSLVMAYFLIKLFGESKLDYDQYKNVCIDSYIKNVLSARTKLPVHFIQSTNLVLKYATRDDFKDKLLPAIQRSLLRNPELVLELIGFLLEDLTIDLSDYSNDLIQTLGGQLIAKDELNRQESANAIKSLAKQCSNGEAIETILKRLFFLLNGGEGKLSTPAQKCVILTASGNASFNCASFNEETLFKIINLYNEFILTETHEGTLLCALQQLNLWFSKSLISPLKNESINKLNVFFKKLLEVKTFSHNVRSLLIKTLFTVYSKNSILHESVIYIPIITQSIEKAINQFTQMSVLHEALSTSIFLVSLVASEPSLETKVANTLSLIYDTKKQLFTHEKFYMNASQEMLKDFCLLFNKLNVIVSLKDNLNLNSYFNGYIYALLSHDYEVRKVAQSLLKQLWKWCGSKLALQLVDTAQSMVNNALDNVENESTDALEKKWPSPKGVCECALVLVSIPNLTRAEIENLALKVLLFSNNRFAKLIDPRLYDKCLHKILYENRSNLNVLPIELIQSQASNFAELTLENAILNETQLNSIETLVRIDKSVYLKKAIQCALDVLHDTRLATITKDEFEIMKLKDGELYDKTLIENALKMQENATQSANLKRENKAYSYKDQLAEIELRKELEKKKVGNKSNAENITSIEQIRSQLTKKQQDSLDQQIQKEAKIRNNMKILDNLVNKATSIIIKLISGAKYDIKYYTVEIANRIINLIKSPLCSSYMFKLYLELGNKVFMSSLETTSFGNAIVYCSFRLSNSTLTLDAKWTAEPLETCFKRLLLKIKSDIMNRIAENNLDIAHSAFLLPFIHFCVSKIGSKMIDEATIEVIIGIISNYSLYRSKLQDEILQSKRKYEQKVSDNEKLYETIFENNEIIMKEIVSNFPVSEYISLLLKIINSIDSIRIQNEVNQTLKDIFLFTSKLDDENAKSNRYKIQLQFDEIIKNIVSPSYSVRETCLDCIFISKPSISFLDELTYKNLILRVWVACFDIEDSNKKKANEIWLINSLKTSETLCKQLTDDIISSIEHLRNSAAEALSAALTHHQNITKEILEILLNKYHQANKNVEPELDQFGRAVSSDEGIDNWEARCGVANSLVFLAELVPSDYVVDLYKFFVNHGLTDRNQIVKNKMLEGAIASLNKHGNSHKNELLSLFEAFLESTPKSAEYDSLRQNVVILMGTLAKHLDKDDPKIPPIIGKLVQALQTPSQQVQEAVANCLYPLMPSIKSQVHTYIDQLMNVLLTAQAYGERRGAAYGLAGMLKGIGMLSLKQLNILQRLNEAVNNKNDAKRREGALLAYEMLTIMFNKVFEPYSVEILPNLLLCFGDSDANVRAAADDCAKAIMANLTFTGVKMILPKLLEHLTEEESWRTKCGSVELLGAMAHCAPKQLGTCLPSIVPKLIEVLSDSHVKVQKSATQALKQIGSVIKNPEILAINLTLLEALQDPAQKTQRALYVLLETKFVHFIDAASLALIMPVVQRAFQDRSTETRKMAAQIMGNMYALTDQKDLQPYLPNILPGLKLSLLDPVPDVRSVSAKALGAMIKAMGEIGLNDIISWLMEKLVSETSSVDRSGAAQGLSEVFGALGASKLEKSMPEIIDRAEQANLSPYVRDGYIMMFIYLPLTFTDHFTPWVGRILPPILKALADESEFVRDTALKAGQQIVNTYAETAISLFLPELEKGLFDSNWRIRYSSVQLLGDLLYKVSGVVGKMSTESSHEDDNFGTESGQKAIIHALGLERRNHVYSGLYMCRSDVSVLVRQAALHVWKIIVSNTPKTLKEILPILFNRLLGCLASTNPDKRQIAAATLVDIVKKLGERILPDIIPILEYGLNSERSEQRQGVCIGLTEIMASTSKDNILLFSDSLIPTIRKALMDASPDVRNCAAKTFDNLHNMIGTKALEEVSIYLLDEMKRNEEKGDEQSRVFADRALDGLRQIMAVKSRVLLPYLIPNLTQPPVNVHALCKLCSCAAVDALSRHLTKILSTLVHALAFYSYGSTDGSHVNWIQECEGLLLSINDPDGVRTIVSELLTYVSPNYTEKSTNPNEIYKLRLAAVDMLTWFCSKTKTDYSVHYDELIKAFLTLFCDSNELLVSKAWDCLNSIIEPLKGNILLQRLPAIRQGLRVLSQQCQQQRLGGNKKNVTVHGFCLPKKGIACILPIFKEGLLNGTPELKEQSALTLCDCIKLSEGEPLKSCVMAVTGPLIRVLGERYSWTVKSAVLDSIYYLLLKVDMTLRPFLPQLQPSFLKALNDPNRVVRLKSGYALAKLLPMNPRLDQVVVDIHGFIKNTEDIQIKETLINSLRLCLNSVGSKLQDDTKKLLLQTLNSDAYLYNDEQQIRTVSAGAIGSLAVYLQDQDFDTFFNEILDYKKHSTSAWKYFHGSCMVIAITLQYCAQRLTTTKYDTKVFSYISNCIGSDRTLVSMSALRAVGFLIEDEVKNGLKIETEIAAHLAKSINHTSHDVKQLSAQLVSYIATRISKPLDASLMKIFIPMLVNGTKERVTAVKINSEMALVNLLHLNENESTLNECLSLMDKFKDSLNDCIKSLSKESLTQANVQEINIDETLIKIDS